MGTYQEENQSTKKSALFLKYIIEEGKFDPNKYKMLLELGQSATSSISQYYVDEYKQFLLSKKVKHDDLADFGLDGARGWLESNGLYVTNRFQYDYRFGDGNPNYKIPDISDFDCIICQGISADLFNVCAHDMDVYLGYCADLASEKQLDFNRKFFNHVLQGINCVVDRKYEMMKDIDSEKRKEFCLIKRKK